MNRIIFGLGISFAAFCFVYVCLADRWNVRQKWFDNWVMNLKGE